MVYNTFKQGLYLGLGIGVSIMEAAEDAAGGMVEKGKNSSEQTSKAAREIAARVIREMNDLQHKGEAEAEKIAHAYGFATASDMKSVGNRLTLLEKELDALKTKPAAEAKKTAGGGAAKKAAPKK